VLEIVGVVVDVVVDVLFMVVVVVVVVDMIVEEVVVIVAVGPEVEGSTANQIPLIPCPNVAPDAWSLI
jgi:hypothetical protein